MRPIRRTSTLVYYDGVQVFEGRDAIGGHYVGVMIASSSDSDRYLVAGIVPERLHLFRTGKIDLRSLFLEAGQDEWILADTVDGLESPVTPVRPKSSDAQMEWLPDDGFFLHDRSGDDLALGVSSDIVQMHELIKEIEKGVERMNALFASESDQKKVPERAVAHHESLAKSYIHPTVLLLKTESGILVQSTDSD